MWTPRIRSNPPMTAFVVRSGLLCGHDFGLVDVGCSGGPDEYFNCFGEHLRVWGFDPLVHEIERLQRDNRNEKFKYELALVGCPNYDQYFPAELRNDDIAARASNPFARTSAPLIEELTRVSSEVRFNSGNTDVQYTDRLVSLDEYFTGSTADIDFLKIDTDGSDYSVLLGAQRLLSEGQILAIGIESQLHGAVHEHANVFSNIDWLLRECGYMLFDIEILRYTRAALPGRFCLPFPAQTETGQTLWGDALYLRDVGDPDFSRKWPYRYSAQKLVKQACLFELYGMPDCAAELLLTNRPVLSPCVDIMPLLDHLTPELNGEKVSFEEYNRRVREDPTLLFAKRSGDPA